MYRDLFSWFHDWEQIENIQPKRNILLYLSQVIGLSNSEEPAGSERRECGIFNGVICIRPSRGVFYYRYTLQLYINLN